MIKYCFSRIFQISILCFSFKIILFRSFDPENRFKIFYVLVIDFQKKSFKSFLTLENFIFKTGKNVKCEKRKNPIDNFKRLNSLI